MEIKQFTWDVVDSNSWLIKEDGHGLLIDAIDSNDLYRELKTLNSLHIILTHSHFDHIYGLNTIRKIKQDSKVIATRLCSEYLGNIYKNMSSSATAFMMFYTGNKEVEIDPITCSAADIFFDEDYELIWRNHKVKLKAYHGHSMDSLIAIVDETLMFSGDTILHTPTVTRFTSGSTLRFWKEDIPKLIAERQVEVVYPGHGNPGMLVDMLSNNKKPKRIRQA